MTIFRPQSSDIPLSNGPVPLIWYARCPTLTALGLIANRGVFQREFRRENIGLVSVRESAAASIRQSYLDHSLPNLIREADAATALWAHGQNEQSRLLAVGRTWHSVSVVARGRQGVRRLSDLAGHRLSLPREAGSFSPAQVRALRAWETVLNAGGVAQADIEFVPVAADHPSVPFGDIARREIEALLGGHTDAALLFGAKGIELTRAAHLTEVHRFAADDIRNDPALAGLVELRTLTVDHALLDAHEEVVTRLTALLLEAARWARAFPKEALRQVALEGQVEEGDAAEAYAGAIAEGADLGLDDVRLAALGEAQAWLKARHLLPEPHHLGPWLRPEVLKDAEHRLRAVA
jgi:ABC-type nitrate/sulfonate/bicarbonate transport system substrate-binding protein